MADRPDELFLIDGNSLVYRAFFALPESIATSTGFPTNAIFGFASMLVKILTEHGTKPTVVVWDAGSSGRKEVYPEYKAQRSTRPTCWPSSGRTSSRSSRRSATRTSASTASRPTTSSRRSPSARASSRSRSSIVTGDRDAFQLIDPEGIVKVMATSRGITETKLYDHHGRYRPLRDRA